MVKFYRILKRSMVLLLLLSGTYAFSQTRITGKVTTADDGNGLPGVSILEKGTSNGTVTNADGNYAISVNENAVLVFSFIGYTTQDVAVEDRTTIERPDYPAAMTAIPIFSSAAPQDITGSPYR